MKSLHMWLVLWSVWLLVCACGAPRALSSLEVMETDEASEGADSLDMTCPPPRPPPTQQPGRGGRNRNRGGVEARGRGRVFNAEPTPQEREAARQRRQSAADVQLLRERYWKWKAEAERIYPEKVGLYEEHHFWPRYLGGPSTGRRSGCPLPTTSSSPTSSGNSTHMAGRNPASKRRGRSC